MICDIIQQQHYGGEGMAKKLLYVGREIILGFTFEYYIDEDGEFLYSKSGNDLYLIGIVSDADSARENENVKLLTLDDGTVVWYVSRDEPVEVDPSNFEFV